MMRWFAATLTVLLLFVPVAAQAVNESDLLPVDQAYRLSATAIGRDRIEFTWRIAPGYYLYKHRMGVALDSVQPLGTPEFEPLRLPAGEKHHDEFFGEVETYRQSVTAILTSPTPIASDRLRFKVKYQGCADIGVCYPPQTRTITVALPPADPSASAQTSLNALAALSGTANSAVAVDASPHNNPLTAALGGSAPLFDNGKPLPEEQAFRIETIATSSSELLVRMSPAPGYYLYRDKTRFQLVDADDLALGAPRWPPGTSHRDEHFGETIVYFEQIEIPLPLSRNGSSARSIALHVDFQGCQTDGICYRPMSRTLQIDLPGTAVVGAASAAIAPTKSIAADAAPTRSKAPLGLWLSLLLAFAGGLILNLMPCVLPVLSFKALALAQSGRSHDHAKAHALWYSLGVLASFAAIGTAVLALRGAGQALGWGFQLQQPSVVAGLTLLLFAIGLSLSGLFQFGAGLAGMGQSLTQKSGALGDFFTGVLAVVVASPCTAPFMGTALGYAFTAPALAALAVFLALGLGMALPFLLIGFVPALAARLPKPGAWMETLRQWLAYPMYFTAIWLAWVFGKQRGVDALALLLIAATLLALGLGWYERRRYLDGAFKKALAYVMFAAALGATIAALRVPAETRATLAEKGAVPYSAARLAALRAEGRPVFVNMTADWCITCKVNEKAVLGSSEFKALLERSGTVYLVGDWTNEDPEISAFLDQFNTPGVPLYVVFPADGGPGRKLPQLLSQGLLREALEPTAH